MGIGSMFGRLGVRLFGRSATRLSSLSVRMGARSLPRLGIRGAFSSIGRGISRIGTKTLAKLGIVSVAGAGVWSFLTGGNPIADVINKIMETLGLPELPSWVINVLLIGLAVVVVAVVLSRARGR